MSRRHVVVLFAIGTLGCLDCWPLFSTAGQRHFRLFRLRTLFSTELCSASVNRPTCLEAAHYIQVLTYLLVACQQEVVWRCRPGRPRVGRYIVHLYRVDEDRSCRPLQTPCH